mgnify:CR=1 FL=1|tara:strand:- start:83748 stop:84359 length:612 start_codon:yes stop_codon:yes gene_type:complete
MNVESTTMDERRASRRMTDLPMQGLLNRLKTDEALMLAYGRGDCDAFERLYLRHKDSLFAYLYRSCPRSAVVEELAQDTWMAVINAAPGYEPRAKFRTWLYQIAHHRLVDFWRRKDNRHEPLDDVTQDRLQDNKATIDREALSGQLMQAIAKLPEDQREALLLQEQGFSIHDIGAITDTGVETIKSRLRYARIRLRQLMGEQA